MLMIFDLLIQRLILSLGSIYKKVAKGSIEILFNQIVSKGINLLILAVAFRCLDKSSYLDLVLSIQIIFTFVSLAGAPVIVASAKTHHQSSSLALISVSILWTFLWLFLYYSLLFYYPGFLSYFDTKSVFFGIFLLPSFFLRNAFYGKIAGNSNRIVLVASIMSLIMSLSLMLIGMMLPFWRSHIFFWLVSFSIVPTVESFVYFVHLLRLRDVSWRLSHVFLLLKTIVTYALPSMVGGSSLQLAYTFMMLESSRADKIKDAIIALSWAAQIRGPIMIVSNALGSACMLGMYKSKSYSLVSSQIKSSAKIIGLVTFTTMALSPLALVFLGRLSMQAVIIVNLVLLGSLATGLISVIQSLLFGLNREYLAVVGVIVPSLLIILGFQFPFTLRSGLTVAITYCGILWLSFPIFGMYARRIIVRINNL